MHVYRNKDYFCDTDMLYMSPIKNAADKPHIHEFLEFVYIYSGSGYHSIDNQSVEVKRGDLIFINIGQTHAVLSDDMQYINCLLKPQFLNEIISNPDDMEALFSLSLFDGFDKEFEHSRCVVRFRGEESLELHNLFGYMLREWEDRQKGWQDILSGYLRVVISKMIRALKSSGLSVLSGAVNTEIINYVNENCFGQMSLSQLAERYFYNPNYLSTKFREISGMSLSTYIRERRMNEAVRLLTETSNSVESISAAVGYAEKSHFYSVFKKYIGMTPNQYRQEKQKTENQTPKSEK